MATEVERLKLEYQDAICAFVEFRKISNHFGHLAKLASRQQRIRAELIAAGVGVLEIAALEQEARDGE